MRKIWRTLGEQIQQLRAARGLTQEQLADTAQLSRIYIQKLELGERESPSFPALERIARALGATLHVTLEVRARRRRRT
jgi:transcriptional regulator with XRE-family HTH domain